MFIKSFLPGAVFLLILSIHTGVAEGSGVRPYEDLRIKSPKGSFLYPDDIVLTGGQDYQIELELLDSYVVSYELLPGIYTQVEVPKDKVQFLHKTTYEIQEEIKERARIEFEKAQRAKGLVQYDGHWMSTEYRAVIREYTILKALKKDLVFIKKTVDKDEKELISLLEESALRNKELLALQERIQASSDALENEKDLLDKGSKQAVIYFNNRVIAHNKLVKKSSEDMASLMKIQGRIKDLSQNTEQNKKSYFVKFKGFTDRYNDFKLHLTKLLDTAETDQLEILEQYMEDMGSLGEGIVSEQIQGRHKLGGAYVNGSINGVLNTNFLIDTGSSCVVISETMAQRLDIPITQETPHGDVIFADGSTQNVPIIQLDLVALGELKQAEVPAAVIPDYENFTPLLGMSFLRHYNWHFEGENTIVFDALNTKDGAQFHKQSGLDPAE